MKPYSEMTKEELLELKRDLSDQYREFQVYPSAPLLPLFRTHPPRKTTAGRNLPRKWN